MRLLVFSTAVATALAFGSPAFAGDPQKDAPKEAPKGDAAVAQALFYEARQLMKEYKYGLACPKLEESLKLDYGIGTEFNLADCNEKVGKIATAWSGFLSVASAARAARQPDREKVAKDRAKALEPRLPKLTIEVPATATPGAEIKRDGIAVGSATWNMPVPVDPGGHEVVVSAPGKVAWKTTVDLTEGRHAKVTIPEKLQSAPVAQGAAATAPPADPASTTMLTSFPAPIIENHGKTQRTAGWIVAGAGVASLALGGAFGIDSIVEHDKAKSHCTGNLCDAKGVSYRDAAMTAGDVSTIATVAGGGALIGGLVLVFTAPKSPEHQPPPQVGSLRAVPQVALNGGGLSLEGVLP